MASYLLSLTFCAALMYQTDSVPRWSWGKFADLESLTPPQNEPMKECKNGQCLRAWSCPQNETALMEPTTCSERGGGWICCVKIFTEKSEVNTPLFRESLINTENNSKSTIMSTTTDWVSVAVNVDRSKENSSSYQEIADGHKRSANIVSWGNSHVYSPKHSHGNDFHDDVVFNGAHKPYVWSKSSTVNPVNRITDEKWLKPVSMEPRNGYLPEMGSASEKTKDRSWDDNHFQLGTKKTSKNWIVNTTPASRVLSTKSSWSRGIGSGKTTNKWESKTTSTLRIKPTNEPRNKVVNSRSTTNTTVQNSWTKSTKSVYDSNYSANSNRNTKPRGTSTTSKPRTTLTTQSRQYTAGLEKKTHGSEDRWANPTKQSWNRNSLSNTEKKSTRDRSNTPTTRKSTTKVPNRASSMTINNRLATPKFSATRSTIGTRKPFENVERSGISSRTMSASTQSTTKKYGRTTPLPNVNSQKCGVRVKSRAVARRGKRQLSSEEFVYTDGSNRRRNRLPFQRIVGGTEAEPFSWPWVAALYRVSESGGNRFLSAGSLINRNFVLTAAHVFTPNDLRSASFVVMLGTHNARESVAEYVVMDVLRHPNYQQRYYYNDIALLRLERPVVFNDYVMPVCLPSPTLPLSKDKDLEGKQVTVMGWGDESYGGKTSRVLQEASFPIVSRKSCNESYFQVASNRFPRGITSNMLCAGDPNGGKDACQGDSGGPLTTVGNGRHTQVGIVSFGYQCGDKEYPGVYTKVGPYLSWIAENARCDDDLDDYSYYY